MVKASPESHPHRQPPPRARLCCFRTAVGESWVRSFWVEILRVARESDETERNLRASCGYPLQQCLLPIARTSGPHFRSSKRTTWPIILRLHLLYSNGLAMHNTLPVSCLLLVRLWESHVHHTSDTISGLDSRDDQHTRTESTARHLYSRACRRIPC